MHIEDLWFNMIDIFLTHSFSMIVKIVFNYIVFNCAIIIDWLNQWLTWAGLALGTPGTVAQQAQGPKCRAQARPGQSLVTTSY